MYGRRFALLRLLRSGAEGARPCCRLTARLSYFLVILSYRLNYFNDTIDRYFSFICNGSSGSRRIFLIKIK